MLIDLVFVKLSCVVAEHLVVNVHVTKLGVSEGLHCGKAISFGIKEIHYSGDLRLAVFFTSLDVSGSQEISELFGHTVFD